MDLNEIRQIENKPACFKFYLKNKYRYCISKRKFYNLNNIFIMFITNIEYKITLCNEDNIGIDTYLCITLNIKI